jgi:group I intron endonuclease
MKSSYICNALAHYGYDTFFLTILEIINITNLSKVEARKLILEREQYYLDTLEPEYNIQKIAGSLLGQVRSFESRKLMSENMKGKNSHRFGTTLSIETRTKIRESLTGRTTTEVTKTKISEAMGYTIYVYSSDGVTLLNTFTSARRAQEFLGSSQITILKYAKNGVLFKDKWILSTNLK